MAKWQVYEYDIWGNKKDGYDVNAVYNTDTTIDIPNVVQSDKALITWLRKIGFLKSGLKTRLIEIDGDENTIYLSYAGRPDCELRKVKG